MTDTNKMRDDLPALIKQSITAHPGYADFSAWCQSELVHPYPIYFLIWQASRQAVVVELPSFDGYRDFVVRELQAAFTGACEAQGLRVGVKS